MRPQHSTTPLAWNRVGEQWQSSERPNPLLAQHKRRVYQALIARWAGGAAPARALKTDLFAEAFNDEEFLSSLPWRRRVVGIDISSAVLQRARCRPGIGPLLGYVTCDVGCLPFRDGAFDLIISDSTLDHFEHEDRIGKALGELARVLERGGRMIVSIDNPGNLTYPPRWLVRLWMRLGLAPYYVGVTLSAERLSATLRSLGLTVSQLTAILHYPHPDTALRLCERCARAMGLGGLVRHCFSSSEQLEATRLRYLTGRYLAVNAVKD